MEACPICGGSTWDPLTNPQARQSMISDLRILGEPLDKWICRTCAVVHRREPLPDGLFTSGYSLYGHTPGAPRECARQNAYAGWIASQCATPPRSVLDVGCGNGSLLLALRMLWPEASMRGIDPSPESVAQARAAGIDARIAISDEHAERADLVISVNVIEHVPDPTAFIRETAALMSADGELILSCPDGRTPWMELLITDHVWSFSPWHLGQLFPRAGLSVASVSAAPGQLGAFAMVRGGRRQARSSAVGKTPHAVAERPEMQQYLEVWRRMDDTILRRVPEGPLVCFGIGEAAGLLRAYAPATWSRVTQCVADGPEHQMFGNFPVSDYAEVRRPANLLLGIRPSGQAAIAARVEAQGHRTIRWDDVVAA